MFASVGLYAHRNRQRIRARDLEICVTPLANNRAMNSNMHSPDLHELDLTDKSGHVKREIPMDFSFNKKIVPTVKYMTLHPLDLF